MMLHDTKKDDVFCEDFLQGVILIVQEGYDGDFAKDARRLLSNRGNIWVDVRSQSEPNLIPGTYVIEESLIRRVFRLYDDQQEAFLTTLKPRNLRG